MAPSQAPKQSAGSKVFTAFMWIIVIGIVVFFAKGAFTSSNPDAQAAASTGTPQPTMTDVDARSAAPDESVASPETVVVNVTKTVTTTVTVTRTPTAAKPSTTAPRPKSTPSVRPKAAPPVAPKNVEASIITARRNWCLEHNRRVSAYQSFGAMSTNRLASSPWAQQTKSALNTLFAAYTKAGGPRESATTTYAGPLGHIIGNNWLRCGPV